MGHTTTQCYLPSLDFVGDVAYVLGRPTVGDEGLLCFDVDENGNDVGKINKWCWFKSIRKSAVDFNIGALTIGDDGFNGDMPTGEFWIGSLEMPYANSLGAITSTTSGGVTTRVPASGSFFDKVMRGQIDWNYMKPRGLATYNERARIYDFNGYNNACVSPMPVAPQGIRELSSTGNVTIQFNIPSASALNNMTLANMHVPAQMTGTRPALNTFYGGLLFYKSDYTDCFWKTSTAQLGTSSAENTNKKVSLTGILDKAGSWKVRPFLSLNPLGFCENPSEGLQIFLLGDFEQKSVGLLTQGQYGSVTVSSYSAKWIAAVLEPTQVRTQVSVLNGTNYTATLSNIKITIEYLGPGEQTYTYDDMTLDTGDTASFAHVFNNVTYGSGFCSCVFSCDVTYNHQTTTLIQQFQATT